MRDKSTYSPTSIADMDDGTFIRDSLFSIGNASSANDLALLVEAITRVCDTHRDEQSKVDKDLLVSVTQPGMLDNHIKVAGVNFASFLNSQLVKIRDSEMYRCEKAGTRKSKIKGAVVGAIQNVENLEDEVTSRQSKGIKIEAITTILEKLKITNFPQKLAIKKKVSASLGNLLDPLIAYSKERQVSLSLLQVEVGRLSKAKYTIDFNDWLTSLCQISYKKVEAPALPVLGLTDDENDRLKKATVLSLKDAIEAANNYRHNPPEKTYLLLLRLSNIDPSFEGIAVAFSPLSGCGRTESNKNPTDLIGNIENVRNEIRDLEGQGQDNEIIEGVVGYLDTQQKIAGYTVIKNNNKAKEEAEAKAKEEAEAEAREEEMRRAQSSLLLGQDEVDLPSKDEFEKQLKDKIQKLGGIIKEIESNRYTTSIFGEVDQVSRDRLGELSAACSSAKKGLVEVNDKCKEKTLKYPDAVKQSGVATTKLELDLFSIELNVLMNTEDPDSRRGNTLCQKICRMIRSLCCWMSWMTTSKDRFEKQYEKALSLAGGSSDDEESVAVTNRPGLMACGQ